MESKNEFLTLQHPEKRRGMRLDKIRYSLISDFILRQINDAPLTEITFSELISTAKNNLSLDGKDDIIWLLIQVKQDLEARGVIITTLDPDRVQTISLHKKNYQKFRQKNQPTGPSSDDRVST
jgi:hypothetical protein